MASPAGDLHAFADACGLHALLWADQPRDHLPITRHAVRDPDQPTLQELARQLTEYFAGKRTVFDLELCATGTPFQTAVWNELQAIPYGSTRTYAQLAAAIGKPNAVRAVGAANGKNPLSIVVPCHRVVGSNGRLTGFAGGLSAKQTLLDLECKQPQLPLI